MALTSAGRHAYLTGDVTHHPLQLLHPEWNVAADVDPEQAAATRREVLGRLAGSDTLVGAGHYPPPGMGTITVEDRIRTFVPASVERIGR